ncbi:restriction endonuclease subunit S [Thauera sp. WH-1]|uniref:restriction endonuclease subunit S n=1 Tax=Thauera sp. WH-1 TaxID=3398230 RepID=UPI0039FC3473
MSFRRYPAYKDSGVEWLGEVPGHWELLRVRQVATLNPSKSEVAALPPETELSFLPMEAIGEDGRLDLQRTRPILEVSSGYTYFRDGDVTIAKITPCFENGKGAVMCGLVGGAGFGTTELIVARPKPDETTSEYLHWVFVSQPFRKLGEASMYGAGGQKRVPDDFVRDFRLAFPPLREQCAISAFLDRETAKIDALVAEQQNLIALLKEKRQALISHAVTKGLDPGVPMKDSGVAWLGEVPAHWGVSALGYLATIETGATPDRAEPRYWNGSIPWLKTGEINWAPIREAEEFITEEGVANTAVRVAKPGMLLMAMYGQGATRGRVARLEIEATYNQACAAILFGDRLLPEFGRYFFMAAYEHVRDGGNETSQMNLSAGLIAKIRLPVPRIDEQVAVVLFLDLEIANLDGLTSEAERAIALLQERRTALISAAVTGKIDVRHLAAASAEPAPEPV